jgi:ribose 5-phosphate isomerase B
MVLEVLTGFEGLLITRHITKQSGRTLAFPEQNLCRGLLALVLDLKLAVGSDEKTVLTDFVVEELKRRGHAVTLSGSLKGEAIGWPDVGEKVGLEVSNGRADQGILFCWTGTGVTIAANKVPGTRAALCWDAETAKGARLWDDANVLAMSLRGTSTAIAKEILDAWFSSSAITTGIDAQLIERAKALDAKHLHSTAK